MRKKIPAKEWFKCDFCKQDSDVAPFKMECSIKINGSCLDHLGMAVCGIDTIYDLCDRCANDTITHLAWKAENLKLKGVPKDNKA